MMYTAPQTEVTRVRGMPNTQTALDHWGWTVPEVWTPRMLTTLENSKKGEAWFGLMEKVKARPSLLAAFARVQTTGGAVGVDQVSVEEFARDLNVNLENLAAVLWLGTYQPQPLRHVCISTPDGSPRPQAIPTVRDRVVHAALRHVLEPIFERDFAAHSYGFRPGRNERDALRVVDRLLQAGCTYVVSTGLKDYFDSIPHERLMERLRRKFADGRLLRVLGLLLERGILDAEEGWKATLGPLLANFYLDPLDHLLAKKGLAMVRYADSFVIACPRLRKAQGALALAHYWTDKNGLSLDLTRTRIVDVRNEAVDFLGHQIERVESDQAKFEKRRYATPCHAEPCGS
jgi:RNA-directed DNA polymerase